MINRKSILILAALFLQCFALGTMCVQRERVLQNGETVFMRTAPVDPRDLFRGDYVRLNYDVSAVEAELVMNEDYERVEKSEQRVYLTYATDDRNVMVPENLTLEKPEGERFIRGYTSSRRWRQSAVLVRYGIEKYFMQQGKGLELERGKRLKGVRIPLEMEVAVGRANGIAVLKGYRYAELGLSLEFSKKPKGKEKQVGKIKIILVNASQRFLAIIDPAEHDSFKIEFTSQREEKENVRIKKKYTKPVLYQQEDLKVIKPQEVYVFTIDLNKPDYQLVQGDSEISWEELKGSETARIVYVSPESEQVQGLKGSEHIWQGRIYSQTFSRYNIVN
jgi:uncharacterized membrane-anchored protein